MLYNMSVVAQKQSVTYKLNINLRTKTLILLRICKYYLIPTLYKKQTSSCQVTDHNNKKL